MLLKRETLRGIRDGSITMAFRRWKRPTVRTGGTLLTPIGQLAIESVDRVAADRITESEAVAAGFADVESLRSELMRRRDGQIYRVRFSLAGPDPRMALRETVPAPGELEDVVRRLERIDVRSSSGAWTRDALEIIGHRPGVRAADLAAECGMEKDAFKARSRKLKGLGLTESLEVGYRLSPRGEAVLSRLAKDRD